MAKKSILETLVAKYNKTPMKISRVEKTINITPEEAEWARENQGELMEAFEEAASKRHSKWQNCPYLEVIGDDFIELVMEW